MSVVVFKMVSGEEIIAKTEYSEIGDIKMTKPRVVQIVPDGRGNAQAGLVPWFLTAADATVQVSKSSVVAQIEAPEDIARMYLQNTSGIDLSLMN